MGAASLAFVSFAHPALLAVGLAAIALPILIHLLMRRRRRPVPWAAMRFLAEALKRQRRRLRLQQWLLLAARCLLIALIGIAIARPILSGDGLAGGGPRTVVLLVDNSITSGVDVEGTGQTELDAHRAAARRVLESLDAMRGDQAALIALAGPVEPVVFPPAADVGGVASALTRVRPADSRADLAGGIELATSLLSDDVDAIEIVLVTAGRAGSLGLEQRLAEQPELADRVSVRVVMPENTAPVDNVAVVDVSPLRRLLLGAGTDAGLGQVRVRLARFGPGVGTAAASRVTLAAASRDASSTIGASVVRWSPGQTEAEVAVTADFGSLDADVRSIVLRASIDADAIAADNTRSTLVRLRDSLRVGIVGTPGGSAGFTPADWARLALAPGGTEPVRIETIRPGTLDTATLAGLDALIVVAPDRVVGDEWARLRDFVDRGGTLVLPASADMSVQRWPDAASEALSLEWRIAREPVEAEAGLSISPSQGDLDELLALVRAELDGLLQPVRVMRRLGVEDTGSLRSAITLTTGEPWMLVGRGSSERGVIVFLASALDLAWTDLPAKPLIVPMLNEILRQGAGLGGGDREVVAGAAFDVPPSAAMLAGDNGDARRIASDGRSLETPIRRAGTWEVRTGEGTAIAAVLVNADPTGSPTDIIDMQRVDAWLAAGGINDTQLEVRGSNQDNADADAADAGGGRLAAWLLAIALGMALVELVLARWTSAPRISATAGTTPGTSTGTTTGTAA